MVRWFDFLRRRSNQIRVQISNFVYDELTILKLIKDIVGCIKAKQPAISSEKDVIKIPFSHVI